MTDKFLQKIKQATQKMREQKSGERELSEKAKEICSLINAGVHSVVLEEKLISAFKEALGGKWYAEPEKEWKPIKWALVFSKVGTLGLIAEWGANNFVILKKDMYYSHGVTTNRPATDDEIDQWYEEFLDD